MRARANLMTLIVASVPEEVIRNISTEPIRAATSAASSTSPSVGAPNEVPARGRRVHRGDDPGISVPEDQRPPRADPIHVLVAVDVAQM